MASRIAVATAFLALAVVFPSALAQAPAPAATTPSGPPNVTAILEKGGQYTTFIRLMKSTQQDTQLNSQLNSSFSGSSGYTVFAPTDNAFNSLKAGTLNSLTQQQQVALVQGHVLPQFYTFESFQTASNPVRTQASGADGPYTLNITASTNNQVNVSSGVVAVTVNNALSAVKPLAVYSVDKVLLPLELFGAKAPAAAPAASKSPKKGGASDAASGPAGSNDADSTGAASARAVGWGLAALAAVASYVL